MIPRKAAIITLISAFLFSALTFASVGYVCFGAHELFEFFCIYYSIYLVIQFILTMINADQANTFQNEGEQVSSSVLLLRLFKAEAIFYGLVFAIIMIVCLFINGDPGEIAQTLPIVMFLVAVFSIPMLFCCSLSVLLFYSLVTMQRGEKMHEDMIEEIKSPI